MKHTRGPWTFIQDDKTATFFSHTVRGQNTDERDFGPLGPTVVSLTGDTESIANGHLIAAAPELLEALEVARKELSIVYSLYNGQDLFYSLEIVKEAINKARGGSNE